jgi:2-polyprenyl-6-methoxyphenol hydroxylase-like FAD-dependent oxidoreductase
LTNSLQSKYDNKSVLISGIGIAGPALAYWLTHFRFKTTLVEKSPVLRTGGYVIDFWGRAFDVAEKMGILSAIKRESYDVNELRLVSASGRRVGGFGVNVFRAATDGRYVSISRGTLAKIIYQKIENRCETIFGDSIVQIDQMDDRVQVEFEHTAQQEFDIVIGADGLHSIVRKLAFGRDDHFEYYLGHMVAAFAVSGYRPRDEDVYVTYSLPGKQVARFAMRDDRTMFLLIFADHNGQHLDPQDTNAQKEILRDEFGDAGWECPQILMAMESCDEIYFDRVSQIRMDAWSKGRVGLVGDAAFCPSLLAGQGAALAMIAGYVLAGELARTGGKSREAFQRYEELLQPFVTSKQKSAVDFIGSFAPKTRLGLFMRNQVSKMFRLPFVARIAMGPSLLDHIDLPDYAASNPLLQC